ncbi:hypothetical protein [Mesorhizobium sp.]|uniref:hypothetical protein n=1 Tax=Mesorhizobium sp. TaxID=1871066 RepID=UPI0025F3A572|nr:hypothetical protein [Mesorhizobium sp.]
MAYVTKQFAARKAILEDCRQWPSNECASRVGGQPVEVRAAPHCPAGHFSPYSDGEKWAGRSLAAVLATLKIGETADDSTPLPVTIRERMPAGR